MIFLDIGYDFCKINLREGAVNSVEFTSKKTYLGLV